MYKPVRHFDGVDSLQPNLSFTSSSIFLPCVDICVHTCTFQGIDFDVTKLSDRTSAPRLVVVDGNTGFIVADGIHVVCHGTVQEMIVRLVMCYYAWDLAYPMEYQLLGFIQKHVFKDNAKFKKSTNFAKFDQMYVEWCAKESGVAEAEPPLPTLPSDSD